MREFKSLKKMHIKTYGCQMNVYDSSRMRDMLEAYGYQYSNDIDDSDLVILNTCHIREKASEKIYSDLGKIKINKIKRISQDKSLVTVVAGCVAQAEGEQIMQRAPIVDIVVGPQSYQKLPKLLENIANNNGKQLDLDFDVVKKFDNLPEESKSQGVSSFITIQEGCDKFCKFCCVPYTRGAQYSRPVQEIFREAISIAKNGAIELTLLGQNVSSYKSTGPDHSEVGMGKLIELISTIPQIRRIRYTTSHPNDMQEDLIKAHANVEKLAPFIHLPVQSGSDDILKRMNRKHKAIDYLRLIEKFRSARPDIAFSSDFIVGYPGEKDQDFQDTLSLVKDVGFAQSYSFKYSPRPGTPASFAQDQVSEQSKSERLQILQNLLNTQQFDFNNSCVGKKMKVIVEKKGKHDNQVVGKSEFMQSVHIDQNHKLIGKMVDVKINKATAKSLSAELI